MPTSWPMPMIAWPSQPATIDTRPVAMPSGETVHVPARMAEAAAGWVAAFHQFPLLASILAGGFVWGSVAFARWVYREERKDRAAARRRAERWRQRQQGRGR